ncbi:MAG: hypothetical protein KDK70_40275, partial [Myxococcales bacterium]|nr:hypothetical protein [Myxococcales bacterium]
PTLLAAPSGGLGLAVALLYGAIGIAIAVSLARRGAPPATALGALACWPLLLPLLSRPATPRGGGPFCARIEEGLQALRRTMADPAAEDVAPPADLDGLVLDLHRADERLAMVDRLLHDVTTRPNADPAVHEGLQTLRRARASAAAEVEAVLDGMVQLRLQIGLRSLAGNSVPVRERLRDLRARLAAVDEIAALELRTHP